MRESYYNLKQRNEHHTAWMTPCKSRTRSLSLHTRPALRNAFKKLPFPVRRFVHAAQPAATCTSLWRKSFLAVANSCCLASFFAAVVVHSVWLTDISRPIISATSHLLLIGGNNQRHERLQCGGLTSRVATHSHTHAAQGMHLETTPHVAEREEDRQPLPIYTRIMSPPAES